MNNFLDISFPLTIPYSSITGPEYSTSVITTASGYEQRNINWLQPRRKFQIAKGICKQDQLHNLLSFFHLCQGKAKSFRLRDWSDYKAEKQILEACYKNNQKPDTSQITTTWQLRKEYKVSNYITKRKIDKPVKGSVVIYETAKEESSSSLEDNLVIIDPQYYQVDYLTGEIIFLSSPNAPLYASFVFDITVRFEADYLPIKAEGNAVYTYNDIGLIEVRES